MLLHIALISARKRLRETDFDFVNDDDLSQQPNEFDRNGFSDLGTNFNLQAPSDYEYRANQFPLNNFVSDLETERDISISKKDKVGQASNFNCSCDTKVTKSVHFL